MTKTWRKREQCPNVGCDSTRSAVEAMLRVERDAWSKVKGLSQIKQKLGTFPAPAPLERGRVMRKALSAPSASPNCFTSVVKGSAISCNVEVSPTTFPLVTERSICMTDVYGEGRSGNSGESP